MTPSIFGTASTPSKKMPAPLYQKPGGGVSLTNNGPTHDCELISKVDPKWRNECLLICYPKWQFSYLCIHTIFCNGAEFGVLDNLDPIYHSKVHLQYVL